MTCTATTLYVVVCCVCIFTTIVFGQTTDAPTPTQLVNESKVMWTFASGMVNGPTSWVPGSDFCSWGGVDCVKSSPTPSVLAVNLRLQGASFPNGIQPLGPLPNVQTIDLSFNRINGPITPVFQGAMFAMNSFVANSGNISGSLPQLWHTPSLGTLSLSDNAITGNIPSTWGYVTSRLQVVDISRNQITGGLVWWNLTTLRRIIVNNNQLTASIPEAWKGMASTLLEVDVSNNLLEGELPDWLLNIKSVNVRGNRFTGPCDTARRDLWTRSQGTKSVITCPGEVQPPPVPTPPPPPGATPNPVANPNYNNNNNNNNKGNNNNSGDGDMWVGIIIAIVVVVVIAIVVVTALWFRRRKQRELEARQVMVQTAAANGGGPQGAHQGGGGGRPRTADLPVMDLTGGTGSGGATDGVQTTEVVMRVRIPVGSTVIPSGGCNV